MPIRRRVIFSRLARGSAILWTIFGELDRRAAFGASTDRGNRKRLPLIVLDAGHGGRDRGATGISGTFEKDVTLASAWALKAMLAARGCYRVELTRTQDRFLPRPDRVEIARDLGASLFMSLHADTLLDPSVRGASVYTLAKSASDAGRRRPWRTAKMGTGQPKKPVHDNSRQKSPRFWQASLLAKTGPRPPVSLGN